MSLIKEGIQLNMVTFDPSDAIEADPTKTSIVMLTITNGEPQDILIKWTSTSKDKVEFQPSCAVIPSQTNMQFRLTLYPLNIKKDSPRIRLSCRVVGCRNNKYRAVDLWTDKKLWKEKVNTKTHKKLIFLEYTNMLPPGWWRDDTYDMERVCWGIEESGDGRAVGAKGTGQVATKENDQKK